MILLLTPKVARSFRFVSAAPVVASGCIWWYQLGANTVGETYCVKGNITSITSDIGNPFSTRIYFENLLIPESAAGRPTPFYFVVDTCYPDLEVNECVVAAGTVQIDDNGEYFIWIHGDLQTCRP